MDIFLFIVYLLVLALQVYLLVVSIKWKTKEAWLALFLTELISMLIAYNLANYYDNLPGYGMMPGFTYFAETLYSYLATIVYGIVLFVSICSGLIVYHRNKGKRA